MTQDTSNIIRFSRDWWLLYQQAWNEQSEFKHKLKKLGKVIFCLTDGIEISVCLHWDEQGDIIEVDVIETIDESLPIFSAPEENWEQFINKEIGAAKAVLTGVIDYQGSFSIIMKYGRHFDYLADVAQKIT
ncbi:MAG: hypothetical protein F6K24_48385 [Okeania sp. SIO2D1]|nr:hypothetical protein [Okeania sp. SIO2D1]